MEGCSFVRLLRKSWTLCCSICTRVTLCEKGNGCFLLLAVAKEPFLFEINQPSLHLHFIQPCHLIQCMFNLHGRRRRSFLNIYVLMFHNLDFHLHCFSTLKSGILYVASMHRLDQGGWFNNAIRASKMGS